MSGYLRAQCATALALALTIPFCEAKAGAAPEGILHAFSRHHGDGFLPIGGPVADQGGNLYGTTTLGGKEGWGAVFKLAPDGTETILYSFTGGDDGRSPWAGLIIDAAGNLYGTTEQGGKHDNGTVFRVTPNGSETVLYDFKGAADGSDPLAGLTADSSGNLYGTTYNGGANKMGSVFKLSADGTETVLYSFKGGDNDGAHPQAAPWMDANGNLYGTTFQGGSTNGGAVFKLSPDGMETVLHLFTTGADGAGPSAALAPDGKGNLYGTAQDGGTGDCLNGEGCGVIFKIGSDDSVSTFYAFPDVKFGRGPSSELIIDKRGNLYGTTMFGGRHNQGLVFEVTRDGAEKILHTFNHRQNNDGSFPAGPLLADSQFKYLYGETSGAGGGRGVVYVLQP